MRYTRVWSGRRTKWRFVGRNHDGDGQLLLWERVWSGYPSTYAVPERLFWSKR